VLVIIQNNFYNQWLMYHYFRIFFLSLAFFSQSLAAFEKSETFSPDRLIEFQRRYTFEQIFFQKHRYRPLPPGVNPPPGMLGFFPLVLHNNTGLDASRVFVFGKGQAFINGGVAASDSFLLPDTTTGVCTLVPADSHNSADSDISLRLSDLPSSGTDAFLLYIPQMASGRFYLSIDTPLFLGTGKNALGDFKIDDPSQAATQDPNFYGYYQDIEYTLNEVFELFINVTNVDYFSVPLTLSSHSFPTGKPYLTPDKLQVVGYPEEGKRGDILSAISNFMKGKDPSGVNWPSLVIPFFSDPYNDTGLITNLRIIAAKLGISLNDGYVFGRAKAKPAFFPTDYLSTDSANADGNYMEALFGYYFTPNTTKIAIFPKDKLETEYTISAVTTTSIAPLPGSNFLSLKLAVDSSKKDPDATDVFVQLIALSTISLLAGDIGTWVTDTISGVFAITDATGTALSSTDPFGTEIAKLLSALFSAGYLPPNRLSASDQPIEGRDSYFEQFADPNSSAPYFINPNGFTQNGPWYNLYDAAVHPQLVKTRGIGRGYAYDFDDLLALAGLLKIFMQSNSTLNPAQPFMRLPLLFKR